MNPLILLHGSDNVMVVCAQIRQGDMLNLDGLDGLAVPSGVALGVGHKVARRALKAGEKVLKYGAPIGTMTQDAAAGEHVHLHNLKSDYIAVHGRDSAAADPSVR